MNKISQKHIQAIGNHFDLGDAITVPTRVYGGLLHKMWHLMTHKGLYALKQLSKDIDSINDQVIKNYEYSEQIASHFIANGIPGVCAISVLGKYLFTIDNTSYLVYPWVDAKALSKEEIKIAQALKIARLLAKMHLMDVKIAGMDEPQFDCHANEAISDLVRQSNDQQLPFVESLNKNVATLLKVNPCYFEAIKALKNDTIISHGDLDQKNVLWVNNNQPILIDWESARKLNPTYEIVNAALDWSGITKKFNKEEFNQMMSAYQEAGGDINNSIVEAALYGAIGNCINWMMYNLKRAITSKDSDQKKMGIE